MNLVPFYAKTILKEHYYSKNQIQFLIKYWSVFWQASFYTFFPTDNL